MSKNIAVSDRAYEKLKLFKEPGDSFSDVILRELPAATAGEVLDRLESTPLSLLPKIDRKREAQFRARKRALNHPGKK